MTYNQPSFSKVLLSGDSGNRPRKSRAAPLVQGYFDSDTQLVQPGVVVQSVT
jgi:hypothetical protein